MSNKMLHDLLWTMICCCPYWYELMHKNSLIDTFSAVLASTCATIQYIMGSTVCMPDVISIGGWIVMGLIHTITLRQLLSREEGGVFSSQSWWSVQQFTQNVARDHGCISNNNGTYAFWLWVGCRDVTRWHASRDRRPTLWMGGTPLAYDMSHAYIIHGK